MAVQSINELVLGLIIPITFLVIIGSAIILVNDPSFMKAKVAAKESSYIASQISNTDITVKIKYDDVEISNIQNQITAEKNGKKATENYYGEPIRINKDSDGITVFQGQ